MDGYMALADANDVTADGKGQWQIAMATSVGGFYILLLLFI